MSASSEKTGDLAAEVPPPGRVLVLAVGNVNAGDDGFGPAVLAALSREDLPENVELADGGVLGIDLLAEIEDLTRLIVVDAIRPTAPAESAETAAPTAPAEPAAPAAPKEPAGPAAFAAPRGGGESGPRNEVGGRDLEAETGRCRYWGFLPDPVPGGVVVFRLSEVELDDPDPRFSLHDLSFGGVLRLARTLKLKLPEIWVVGYPLASDAAAEGLEMSPAAVAAVGPGCAAVKRLLTV